MIRIPIYFVIGSGLPKEQIKSFVMHIVNNWKKDPFLLESMYISIVYYSEHECSIADFVNICEFDFNRKRDIELHSFYPLDQLAIHIDSNISEKTVGKRERGFKPLILVFSSDNIYNHKIGDMLNWSQKYQHKTNMVVFDIGKKSNPFIIDLDDWEDLLKISFNVLTHNTFHVKSTTDDLFDILAFVAHSYTRYVWLKMNRQSDEETLREYNLFNPDKKSFYTLEYI